MNKNLKKLLAAVAFVPCMCMAAACGDVPPPAEIGAGGTIGSSSGVNNNPQYTNVSNLKLFEDSKYGLNFDEYQGKIDDFIAYGSNEFNYAIYSDGVLHNYYIDYNDVKQHETIHIGIGYKIVYYDGNDLVVSNSSGDVFYVIGSGEEVEFLNLGCTVDQYRFIDYNSAKDEETGKYVYYYVCCYVENGYLKVQKFDYDELTPIGDAIDAYCNAYDSDENLEFTSRIRDLFALFDEDLGTLYDIFILTDNDYICEWNSGNRVKFNKDENKCYFESENSKWGYTQIPNTVSWEYDSLVQVKGDNAHLYYFEDDDDSYESIDTWYTEAAKIKLPDGYEVDDIEFIKGHDNDLDRFFIVKFNDNTYYEIYGRYLTKLDIEHGETLGMWKNNKLTNIDASCNIKKMYFKEEFGGKVIMLMDDGCLYKTSVHINIDL